MGQSFDDMLAMAAEGVETNESPRPPVKKATPPQPQPQPKPAPEPPRREEVEEVPQARETPPSTDRSPSRSGMEFTPKNIDAIVELSDRIRNLSYRDRVRVLISSELGKDMSDGDFIYAVLHASEGLRLAMGTILKAHEEDPFERPFFLMGLRDDELRNIGGILAPLSDTIPEKMEGKLVYARAINSTIKELDSGELEAMREAQSLLAVDKDAH